MSVILGLDFGGTKLAAGLLDTESGQLLGRAHCTTPVTDGAEGSLAAMLGLARELLRTTPSELTGVGVSFGGPVAADGRVVRLSMHVPGWENMPLAERLEHEFGVQAQIANDGDAAALAEHRLGAGRRVRNLIYVTVSTGIGGGIVINGQLYRGERAWAGEIGHMVLDPNGPPCPCGRNGCLESLASGLSIARDARLRLSSAGASMSVLHTLPLEQVTAQAVAVSAAMGDPLASELWDTAMAWLGIGLASAANLLNPGRIVVGGGLTRAGDLLFKPVQAALQKRALDPELEVVPAALGNDVGILGGAALWLHST